MDLFKNLTAEEKKTLRAQLGVLIMTILIGAYIPILFFLIEGGLGTIYIAFIMLIYTAVLAYMERFVIVLLKTKPEDIPELPTGIVPDTE